MALTEDVQVFAEIVAPGGTVKLPLDHQDGFRLVFSPSDIVPYLDAGRLDGNWFIGVLAEYSGQVAATDYIELLVRDLKVYLPVAMR